MKRFHLKPMFRKYFAFFELNTQAINSFSMDSESPSKGLQSNYICPFKEICLYNTIRSIDRWQI